MKGADMVDAANLLGLCGSICIIIALINMLSGRASANIRSVIGDAFEQHVERTGRRRHAPDFLDLGPSARLPIIEPLKDLVRTGDEVRRIVARWQRRSVRSEPTTSRPGSPRVIEDAGVSAGLPVCCLPVCCLPVCCLDVYRLRVRGMHII